MKIKRLIKISRPRFWIYEAGTFGVGYVASMASLHDLLRPSALVWFLFFLIPANLLIYGINDIFDYETDKLNPRKIEYEALVVPSEHKILFRYIVFLIVLFFPLMIGLNFRAIASLFVFFFCAIFYSAPPIRAKARPFLDSLFSASHYVATGAFGYVLINNSHFPMVAIVGGMCWGVAMHAYSAVPDITSDQEAGLSTVATHLGKNKTIVLCTSLYLLSAFLFSFVIGPISYVFFLVYFVLMILSYFLREEKQVLSIYKYFPIINFVIPTITTVIHMAKTFGHN